MQKTIRSRTMDTAVRDAAEAAGLTAVLAGIVARRVTHEAVDLTGVIHPALKHVPAPHLLKDADVASQRLTDAILNQSRIGILTDYDVDGITSHVVIYHALTHYFGVNADLIDAFIGHRIDDGYGVSERLVDRILDQATLPEVIITADCGSSDEAQIARLAARGIDVIVTDHHAIPTEGVPASAVATVNPTQDGCDYPDKRIAGCMVSWLLMSQLRATLLSQGVLPSDAPKLAGLLDFVALGTVADAVALYTPANRAVVKSGLAVMNQTNRPCWMAMKSLLKSKRDFDEGDLGFQLGPRINARSRMADPYAALHYLLAVDVHGALNHLSVLDADNQDRKATEREMQVTAREAADAQLAMGDCYAITVYDEAFHAGVQGIVASRLVERYGRVVAVISPTNDPEKLTGSLRSVLDVHVRDALQWVADQDPEIMMGFGGHQGAAGVKIRRNRLDDFTRYLNEAVAKQVSIDELVPVIWTDGPLSADQLSLTMWRAIRGLAPFGRAFEAPVFEGVFVVKAISVMGKEPVHLSMQLVAGDFTCRAVWFFALDAVGADLPFAEGEQIHCAYELDQNTFRGMSALQLRVVHAAPQPESGMGGLTMGLPDEALCE